MTEVIPVQPKQPGPIENSTNHEFMNESMSDKCVCRTAPATPGLINTFNFCSLIQHTQPIYIPQLQLWFSGNLWKNEIFNMDLPWKQMNWDQSQLALICHLMFWSGFWYNWKCIWIFFESVLCALSLRNRRRRRRWVWSQRSRVLKYRPCIVFRE